jgi:predicted AlkP superfamily phosphohydrolase/phosphomutase
MIHGYYRQLDDILGRILKHDGPDTSVFVISDHGFGPIRKEIYINKWLAEQGFLTSASNPRSAKVRTALRTLARRLGITRDRWRQAFGPRATKAAQALVNTVRIDWSRTKAYSNGVNTVQVNLKGREPYGIINAGGEYEEVRAQVIERLAELRDPETGRRVVKAIIPREKAGTGPYLGQAPDLLMLMADEGYAAYECDVDVDHVFEAPRWRNGEHTLEGVLTAAGKHIRKGSTIVGATIMDLAPTILYRMGLPIPDDMDGQVLTDLFEHQFLGANTPLKARAFEQAADRHVSASERAADEETILERLKGLGYID